MLSLEELELWDKGASAKAWCLLIHAASSLCLSRAMDYHATSIRLQSLSVEHTLEVRVAEAANRRGRFQQSVTRTLQDDEQLAPVAAAPRDHPRVVNTAHANPRMGSGQ